MIEYKRNLPHILPKDGVFFITYRVKDSLPLDLIVRLKNDFKNEVSQAKEIILNSKVLRYKLMEIKKQYFLDFDHFLDKYINKHNLTENKPIANIVSSSLHYLDNKDYKLICYCIMPNHVHLIIHKLKKPLYTIMKVLKGYTAREINTVLNLKGSFWHAESYDHVIRSRRELHNTIQYVLKNPLKAGLTNSVNEWEWSYCDPIFLEEQ